MDWIIANSRISAKLVMQFYERESSVIYPGVDASVYQPSNEREPYILAVSMLTSFKNLELAIDAVAMCREELSAAGVRLQIAGDGPFRRTLERRAGDAGLESLVQFLGVVPREEIIRLYSHALMTLFTTLREPFGLVPLESMACKTPVISVNAGGPGETVLHGRTGLLADPTPESFAACIVRLIRDRALIERMGSEGRAHVLANFTWERTARAFEECLNNLQAA